MIVEITNGEIICRVSYEQPGVGAKQARMGTKSIRLITVPSSSGLTMKKSKMKRCAASCDGQDCKAER